MSRLRLRILEPNELKPFVPSLRDLESQILYPIADGADTFAIDHGPDYHSFFSDMGRRARFMVVEQDGEAVGSLAGVWRDARLGEDVIPTAYLGDMKLAKTVRGGGVAARMLWKAMRAVFRRQDLRDWSMVWVAAMRGAEGDVMRSVNGAHPGRLAQTLGITRLYFIPSQELVNLDCSGSPKAPDGPGLDLSPEFLDRRHSPIVSTRGSKDFRLTSTGKPWPLIHVACGPRQWAEGFGESLVKGARAALKVEEDAICCFGLDVRMYKHIAWLAQKGFEPGATCTVYGFPIESLLPSDVTRARWIHLATCHI